MLSTQNRGEPETKTTISPTERAAMTYSFIRVVGAIRPFGPNEKDYFSKMLKKLKVSSVTRSERIKKTTIPHNGIDIAVVTHNRFFISKPSGADACVPATISPVSDCVFMLICRHKNKTKNQVIEYNTKTAVMVIIGILQESLFKILKILQALLGLR